MASDQQPEDGCPLRAWDHPASCALMRITCDLCGHIGNTESLNDLPPCPRQKATARDGD